MTSRITMTKHKDSRGTCWEFWHRAPLQKPVYFGLIWGSKREATARLEELRAELEGPSEEESVQPCSLCGVYAEEERAHSIGCPRRS